MSRIKIAVLISGGGTNLQSLIDYKDLGGDIDLVVSNHKDAYGLVRAEKSGIESVYLDSKGKTNIEYDTELLELFKDRGIKLVVLAGYLKIITKVLIDEYANKIINIHPSLIPSFCGNGYYGLRVHEAAIEYGVKFSGATTHFVNEETDGGPIIMQDVVEISDDDTAESLQKKVLDIEHRILSESVRAFCENRIEIVGRTVKIRRD
ncbi:MAG: phosphoribosylglycinamide formyltransferase [Tissierellia bacterium]|nr:phosphoribosylglycinamide formyltransferase [Tissierellia bacterium]